MPKGYSKKTGLPFIPPRPSNESYKKAGLTKKLLWKQGIYKLRPSRKGISISEKVKKKISNSHKMRYILNPNLRNTKRKNFKIPYRKNFKLSEEHKNKISKSHKLRYSKNPELRKEKALIGKKNPFWKGGITPTVLKIRNSKKYENWRKYIFERDNFTCQFCRRKGNKIQADHIIPFSCIIEKIKFEKGIDNLYEKALEYSLLWDTNNGRTLCIDCHKKTDSYLTGKIKLGLF